MNEVSTKVKKLNIFQILRMSHVKKLLTQNRISINSFLKLPEYIQLDQKVLAMAADTFEDEELRRINPNAICAVKQDLEFLRGYPNEIILQLIQTGTISIDYKTRPLVYDLISSGHFEVLDSIDENINYGLKEECYRRLVLEGKNEQAKEMLQYLRDDVLFDLCKEDPDVFGMLPLEKQIVIADKETSFFKLLPIEEQHKAIQQGFFYRFNDMSLDAKISYIRSNPGDILKIDKVEKIRNDIIELVEKDISLYEILPNKWKRDIQENFDDSINVRIITSLLLNDIKSSKELKIESATYPVIKNVLPEISKNMDDLSDEELINLCLHSKMLSAIGKLSDAGVCLHGDMGSEKISGIDSYNKEQIEFFKKLDLKTMEKLTRIDSNYVLPYLTAGEISRVTTHDERLRSEERARALFTSLYGEEKYNEYSQCFSTIFDLEEIYTNSEDRNLIEVPLEELKILFNSTIMEKCNSELIKEYFNALKNNEDTRVLFEKIIQEAYGDRALEIVKSRPQLNVHSINSLEVFDSRILDEYGEGFVHDCISYNIRNFSEFLEVIKDEEKSELFKEYYSILTGIYGNNVETMQKAISEFSYVEGILRQVKDVDLTNEQSMNLLNVLCSEKNPLNIETLDDLNNYNNLANEQLQRIILELEIINDESNKSEIERIKDDLCANLLGIGLIDSRARGYGNTLQYIYSLYDISEGESSREEYSSEEKRFLNIMSFIIEEKDPRKLLAFIQNIRDITSIRNYTAVANLIEKVQERELSQMNEQITTLEKLDEACEREKDSETPSVYKEEIEGVQIYHLNGEPFCMFKHDPGRASLDDLLHYEGQAGNMAICTRIVNSSIHPGALEGGMYLYGEIQSNGLILMNNSDAGTTHVAKRTRMYGFTDKRVTEVQQIDNVDNEVAMYRRQRDHSRITNDNVGGNIPPMAYSITMREDGTISNGSSIEEVAERFKGTGIAIIVYHPEAYRKREQLTERGKSTTTHEDVLSR